MKLWVFFDQLVETSFSMHAAEHKETATLSPDPSSIGMATGAGGSFEFAGSASIISSEHSSDSNSNLSHAFSFERESIWGGAVTTKGLLEPEWGDVLVE